MLFINIVTCNVTFIYYCYGLSTDDVVSTINRVQIRLTNLKSLEGQEWLDDMVVSSLLSFKF